MLFLTDLLKKGNFTENYLTSVRQGVPSAVFGVPESLKRYLYSATEGKVVVIEKDHVSALATKKAIEDFSGRKTVYIPAKHDTLTSFKAQSKDVLFDRIIAEKNIADAEVVVLSLESATQLFSNRIGDLTLKKGEEHERSELVSKIVSLGYKRAERTESKATFSVRGDVLDVFPIDSEDPVRIDFFGDEVESIKYFDADSGKSLKVTESVSFLSALEFDFEEDDKDLFLSLIKNETLKSAKEKRARLEVLTSDLSAAIENGDAESMELLSCLSKNAVSFFDLIPEDAVVILNEPKRLNELYDLLENEFAKRREDLVNSGENYSFSEKNFLKKERFTELLKRHRLVATSALSGTIPFFDPLVIINANASAVANYRYDLREFYSAVIEHVKNGLSVIVACGNLKNAEMLAYDLEIRKISSKIDREISGGVTLLTGPAESGFIIKDDGVVFIGSGNILAKPKSETGKKLKRNEFFTAPTAGDYCVHETHGVGRVLGDKKISSTEGTKDYIAVEYGGGDILYIPVEQMDVLTRYLGSEKHPKLSKIGGKEFEKIKARAKESIKKMSFDLKKLYSEREAEKGFKFEVDGELYELFRDGFEFEDTPDQKTAESDILSDMEKGRIMDRLVCGDVGFGKTEIALRSAFIAVSNGKQVAMLAPTTILTEQHYSTAKKRFEGFGVRIACLNRFRSKKEQKDILDKTAKGEIDLLIGTHRLLSSDVAFKDLGLLILDEEQRFGVEHKEKIKLLKKNVDTLTLTATPIPRTLHLSLSGIRPISTINTPPKNRLPVQTFVTEETDGIIKDALSRELGRGGQAFVLYNRVESIYTFAEKVKKLVPTARVAVTHGRMEEKVLEDNVMKFYRGEYDVLVSTTIIENGIDLPRANTLVVIDADTMGLSTLYQLKGRVGRGENLAYAYFTYKRDKILTATAYERLNAITEFAEMGSGIKVAMRDLEIRGAGNVLGAEQHGHMDKIGYELYSKLLKEQLSGEETVVPELDVRVSAFIPENYIESVGSRMDAYKEIAEINSFSAEKDLIKNLKDAYGKIPEETASLIDIAVVKFLAARIKAKRVVVEKKASYIEFRSLKSFSNVGLKKAMDENGEGISLSMASAPRIEFKREHESNDEMLKKMRAFLESAVS